MIIIPKKKSSPTKNKRDTKCQVWGNCNKKKSDKMVHKQFKIENARYCGVTQDDSQIDEKRQALNVVSHLPKPSEPKPSLMYQVL